MAMEALPLPESVGQRIRYVRDFMRGWSQTRLAKEVTSRGVQMPNYRLARIESGLRPSLLELVAIADALPGSRWWT